MPIRTIKSKHSIALESNVNLVKLDFCIFVLQVLHGIEFQVTSRIYKFLLFTWLFN